MAIISAALFVSPAGGDPRPLSRPLIGVYYFPGWLKSTWGPPGGWEPIKRWPDRKPLLGWYDQASGKVVKQQLSWMADLGIDYVVVDWYYNQGSERMAEGLNAYLSVPRTRVKLSLLWANHDETTTPAIWRAIVRTWLDRYAGDPRFLTKSGKPVIFIWSYERLAGDAESSGSSARAYVDAAQAMARAAGLPGLYLVAGTDDFSADLVAAGPLASGFSAVSGYQMHRKPRSAAPGDPEWARPTHGWAGLAAGYQAQWEEGLKLSLPMVVPMIAGLDRRPWGGWASDPLHDRSIATAAQFEAHLRAARRVMMRPVASRSELGVICCWNEFGEGAFIEPTTQGRFAKLEAVRRVFGSDRAVGRPHRR